MGIDYDYSPLNAYYMASSTPTETPPAGWVLTYYKSDGNLYTKNSTGAELKLTANDIQTLFEQVLTDPDLEIVLQDQGDLLYDTGVTG